MLYFVPMLILISFIFECSQTAAKGDSKNRRIAQRSKKVKEKRERRKKRRRKRRGLFVVNNFARVQAEPSSFSPVIGLLKFKAWVRVMGKRGEWFKIKTPHKKMVGFVHKDSLMPLRKIRRFLKKAELRNLEKKEEEGEGIKGFSEEDEVSAGTKGFSEEDEVAAASKGFSEEDEVSAGTKGLNNEVEKDMEKSKYDYEKLKQLNRNLAMLNPYRRLRKFRKKRKIGEFYLEPAKLQRKEKLRSIVLSKLKHHGGFLPSEEYYIGKTTAAYMLARYKSYGDGTSKLERYINNIGRTLGMASIRPEVFMGYRILIIKSENKNAFANPGGFIFITTGLLKLAKYEDEIAGVLAHEIAHIALRHPTKSINRAYRQDMMKEKVEKRLLRRNVEKSVEDVFKRRNTGFDSQQEKQADKYAIIILMRLGYEPMGLVRIIKKLEGGDEVHGDPQERAENLKEIIRRQKTRFGLVTRIPKFRRKIYKRIIKDLD